MQRLRASGAAVLLIIVLLMGCAAGHRPPARGAGGVYDRRIEEAQREIEAHDRELRRQRAEIEAMRTRAEVDEWRSRAAIEALRAGDDRDDEYDADGDEVFDRDDDRD
jgi:hypothetical protein